MNCLLDIALLLDGHWATCEIIWKRRHTAAVQLHCLWGKVTCSSRLHLGWLPVIITLSAHSIQSYRIYYEEYRHTCTYYGQLGCLWAFSPGDMPIVQQVMLLGKSKPPLLYWLAKFSGCRFNCKMIFCFVAHKVSLILIQVSKRSFKSTTGRPWWDFRTHT